MGSEICIVFKDRLDNVHIMSNVRLRVPVKLLFLRRQAKTRTNTPKEQRELHRLPKKITERRLNWYRHVIRRG